MARRAGFEPTVYRLEVCCLIHLATDAFFASKRFMHSLSSHVFILLDKHPLRSHQSTTRSPLLDLGARMCQFSLQARHIRSA